MSGNNTSTASCVCSGTGGVRSDLARTALRRDRRPRRPCRATVVSRDPPARDTPGAQRYRRWLPIRLERRPLTRRISGLLRFGVAAVLLWLVAQYLVAPELVGAGRGFYLLSHVTAGWLICGLLLEAVSLLCYGLLTRALLPSASPGLFRLLRIDLAAAAVAHVMPAGGVSSAGVGYRLFRAEGIRSSDAAVMMAVKGYGSAVVLNMLLWITLIVLIPLTGFHPLYGTVLIVSGVIIAALASLMAAVTRDPKSASRLLRPAARLIPGLSGEGLERAFHEASKSMMMIWSDHGVLARSLLWACLNWLLDAASLWCFVAAFGSLTNPLVLFAAYGLANVAGALPLTPAGLGIIETVGPLLLVSSGVTRSVATLGVLAWRLVNFWLPIPAGMGAYLSLKMRSRQ
jgi:uncharacterized protein (TIRG00374 family)